MYLPYKIHFQLWININLHNDMIYIQLGDRLYSIFMAEEGIKYAERIVNIGTWPESASELYWPSDRHLSAKLMPTFVEDGGRPISSQKTW
jgi:hypothetical protein